MTRLNRGIFTHACFGHSRRKGRDTVREPRMDRSIARTLESPTQFRGRRGELLKAQSRTACTFCTGATCETVFGHRIFSLEPRSTICETHQQRAGCIQGRKTVRQSSQRTKSGKRGFDWPLANLNDQSRGHSAYTSTQSGK